MKSEHKTKFILCHSEPFASAQDKLREESSESILKSIDSSVASLLQNDNLWGFFNKKSAKMEKKRRESSAYQLIKSNCTVHFGIVILFLLFPAMFAGCYSFHGGSPPEGVKTIAVPVLNDESGFANATIRDQTTTQLIQKFTRDHTLQVVDKASADAVLDATIKSITNKIAAIGADDRSSRQHIDVTVDVTLENLRKHKTIWEKPFTSSAEYDPNGDVTQRDAAVLQALDHITDDIVLETVSQW